MAHSERHEELVAAVGPRHALRAPIGPSSSAHLAEGCPRCEELLARSARRPRRLWRPGAPPVAPPPELRAPILAALGPARVPRRARASHPASRASSRRRRRSLLVAVGLDDARLRREREDLRSQSAELAGRLADGRDASSPSARCARGCSRATTCR